MLKVSTLRAGLSAAPRSWTLSTLWLRLRFHLIVLLLYAIYTLYILANVLPHSATAIPGSGVALADGWQNTWNFWWVARALQQGTNPYRTDMLFFPEGTSLYLHTLNITNSLITLPVLLAAGPLAAYNTAVFLGFVLTGLATYLLALRLIQQRVIACIVGALFTFSPFHLSKLWDGHLSWVTLQWVPFYFLALLIALDDKRWRMAIVAGVFLGIATLTSWYYVIFSAVFTALLMLVRAPAALQARTLWREVRMLLIVGGVMLMVTAPVVVPTVNEYLYDHLPPPRYEPESPSSHWDGETGVYSADILDILYPSFLHPLWGNWSRTTHEQMRSVWFWTISPGLGVLLLALLGSVMYWRRVWHWAVLVISLWLLMLGPELRVNGVHTSIKLPYDFLRFMPGMSLAHRPNHLAIYMLPLLMVLAGFGMLFLWHRQRWGRWLLSALGVVIALEYMVLPFPTMSSRVRPQIASLSNQGGAVLDLPPDERTSGPMNNQMVHGRPIVGGYLARQFDVPPFVEKISWLSQLWQLYPDSDQGPDIVEEHPDDGQQALRFYDITTILVRRDELEPFQQRDALRALHAVLPTVEPTYDDAGLSIYQIPPVTQAEPFLFLGSGWLPREHAEGRVWRWMSRQATLYIVNPDRRARWVTLAFNLQSYKEARTLDVQFDGASLGSFVVQPAEQMLRLQIVLPSGEHSLRFTSTPERENDPARRLLSFSFSHIELVR